MITIIDLFQQTVDKKASDLHILNGYFPTIRINDTLYPLKTTEILTKETCEKLISSILSKEQKEELEANKEIDVSYAWNNYRFRVNCYYERESMAACLRIIPAVIKTIEELQLPPILHKLAQFNDGLVLLTGPTGEGKSTTLASILNEINLNQEKHIITIEDPIEFIYPRAKSIVSQRELHHDTHSWTKALKSVLREDPNVVLIGEMRDFDTIQAALTIAETGHLVFSTLHTSTTPEAINRIIDVFPPNQQNQIRHQLASSLRTVISQRLVPNIDNTGRVAALEILMNTSAVSTLIREGKTYMIDNVIETGEEQDMILFEKYLAKLYRQNMISRDTAINLAQRPNEIKKFIV